MSTTKAMTLRLPDDKARELEIVARADDVPVSEAVRAAIDEHIARRRKDKTFQTRIRKILSEDQEVFDRLAQ